MSLGWDRQLTFTIYIHEEVYDYCVISGILGEPFSDYAKLKPVATATNVPIVGNNTTTVIVQTVQMSVTTKQSQT